jgi:hypothetical protein
VALPAAPFLLLAAALGCLWLLRSVDLPGAETAPGLSQPAARTVGALRQVDLHAVTRTGETWRLAAAAWGESPDGVSLHRPRLGVLRGGRILAAVRAEEGLLASRGARMVLTGDVELRVGADLEVLSPRVVLEADGRVVADGPAQVRTPQGARQVAGVRLAPAEGKVILAAGTPAEQALRWSGWGPDLSRLGEACRSAWWASRAEEPALQRAGEAPAAP